MAWLLLPWGRRGQVSAGGRGQLSGADLGKNKSAASGKVKSQAVLDKVAGNGAMRLGRLKEKISFFRAVRW